MPKGDNRQEGCVKVGETLILHHIGYHKGKLKMTNIFVNFKINGQIDNNNPNEEREQKQKCFPNATWMIHRQNS